MSVWFDPSGMVVPIGANHTGPVIYKNSRNISDGFIVVRLTLLIRKAFTCLETGVYTCSFGGEEKRDFFIDSPNGMCVDTHTHTQHTHTHTHTKHTYTKHTHTCTTHIHTVNIRV